jgi:hypothetical protein
MIRNIATAGRFTWAGISSRILVKEYPLQRTEEEKETGDKDDLPVLTSGLFPSILLIYK